ncbi:MAG: hypothetical protein ACXIU7_13075 [Roseinatronobacter sp.]
MLMPDRARASRLPRRADAAAALRRAVPGLALAGMGAGALVLGGGQPAWLGGDVGPGLMAQILGQGILGLGLLWAVLCALDTRTAGAVSCEDAPRAPAAGLQGPLLLGGVLIFALTLPSLGLVIAAGCAATLAAIGAGERAPLALVLTVSGLMGLTAAIGVILLPPTAPLWPRF